MNIPEVLTSVVTFAIMYRLFYVRGRFKIIFVGLFFQWLSISIKPIYGLLFGLSLDKIPSYYTSPDNIQLAFYLSSIGLIAYALGLARVLSKTDILDISVLKTWLNKYQARRVVLFYLSYSLLIDFLWLFRYSFPGLNTAFYALKFLSWGFLVLAMIIVFYQRKSVLLLSAIVLVQVVLSFASYFSEFKEYIIFAAIAYLSYELRITNFRRVAFATLAIVGGLFLGTLWTAVKGDYRYYLSGGQNVQKVLVERDQALRRLIDLSSNVEENTMNLAVLHLVDRIGYIDFFSITLGYVPKVVQHENGSIWLGSISHFLKPRLFFPDKPVIDDSKHLNKYTGLGVAGIERSSSHSLGYMADSYIDFGAVLMFIPIYLLGWLTGRVYLFFSRVALNPIWTVVLTVPFFYLISVNGMSSVKVIGNLLIFSIVAFLFNHFIAPRVDHLMWSSGKSNPRVLKTDRLH